MKTFLALAVALVTAASVSIGVAASASSQRSGTLKAAKECSQWDGSAGSFCTITSSNLNEIKVGSRVVYASAVTDFTGVYESDLMIDGPGNNDAFGHVVVDLGAPPGPAPIGEITFSGGTGVFAHFHAGPIVVACSDAINCSWDGPYKFSPPAK
jgi:hypothetical protein